MLFLLIVFCVVGLPVCVVVVVVVVGGGGGSGGGGGVAVAVVVSVVAVVVNGCFFSCCCCCCCCCYRRLFTPLPVRFFSSPNWYSSVGDDRTVSGYHVPELAGAVRGSSESKGALGAERLT